MVRRFRYSASMSFPLSPPAARIVCGAAVAVSLCFPRLHAEKGTEIVTRNMAAVAIIEGDAGTGTGFIAKADGVTRLYTAAHVITGNKKLTVKNNAGRRFTKFGAFEVAADNDIARLELLEDVDTGLRIAPHNTADMDDGVIAIGNSGGAGVLTVLEGEILSVGPELVEVSNSVIQGNSGGPLFCAETGEVLAVITHLTAERGDIWAKDTKFAKVRRFACRLDRKVTWQKVPIGRFLAEAREIDEFNRNSRLLFAISMLDPSQAGLRLDTRVSTDGPTLLKVFEENKDVRVVEELIDMNSKLGDKRTRTSESDLRRQFGSFYAAAISRLDHNGDKFAAGRFTGYHRKMAKDARTWRDDALKSAKSAAERMR